MNHCSVFLQRVLNQAKEFKLYKITNIDETLREYIKKPLIFE